MPRLPRLLCFLALLSAHVASAQAPPIGGWREHLPFNNALQVDLDGEKVHCATPYGFFTYDKADRSFSRKTRINGLSEVRVRLMTREPGGRRLALVHENSNIDIIDGAKVANIPDLMLSRVSGDKTVYGLLWQGNAVYLCTGIGIVVVDPSKREIRDTYRPSSNGSDIRVNGIVFSDGFFFAATAEGLKRAEASAATLSDYRRWQTVSGNGLAAGACQGVALLSGSLVVRRGDSLLIRKGDLWRPLPMDPWPVTGFNASGDRLLVSHSQSGKGRVRAIDTSGAVREVLQTNDLSLPRQAVRDGAAFWVADQNNGLLRIESGRSERVFPNSPISIASGDLLVNKGEVWAAAGAVNEAWNYTYNPNGLYRLKDDIWTGINLYVYPKIDSLLDLITLAADPSSDRVFAGSYGGGLLEVGPGDALKVYKQQTGLQEAIGDRGSYRVAGLDFDSKGNLWIANYGAPQNLVARMADGSWKKYTIPFLHAENAVSQVLVDQEDRKWVVSPKGNGLFCFDEKGTPDNNSDDRWRYFRFGKGSGNLPSSEVYCLAEDRDGFIWIGTSKGIAIVTCTDEVFSNGCEATLPIVKQDNFFGYLLADEQVLTIAVDGANRKWVGTRNGIWLISPDGEKVIERFNVSNSPLLGNQVSRIAVHPVTGEVFISTFNGICSYRGTATEGGTETVRSDVLVYPNPVPPGYDGSIAIRGLRSDAIVKVTEPDGRLVHQARAFGGQAVWNGRNYKGEKVASGAYLVLVTDEQGRDRLATKVFIVR
jgi:hypothetical protein